MSIFTKPDPILEIKIWSGKKGTFFAQVRRYPEGHFEISFPDAELHSSNWEIKKNKLPIYKGRGMYTFKTPLTVPDFYLYDSYYNIHHTVEIDEIFVENIYYVFQFLLELKWLMDKTNGAALRKKKPIDFSKSSFNWKFRV